MNATPVQTPPYKPRYKLVERVSWDEFGRRCKAGTVQSPPWRVGQLVAGNSVAIRSDGAATLALSGRGGVYLCQPMPREFAMGSILLD